MKNYTYGNLIKFEKDGDIGIVAFDNAEKFNTITHSFFEELIALRKDLLFRNDLRAIAIVSNGKYFSAGFDISYLNTISTATVKNESTMMQRAYNTFQEISIPVVVGVQGVCYGSAMEIILACDIRILADNARLAILEVKYGLAPDLGGTTRLTKLVGPGQAKRLIMGCDEIDAQEAKMIGLAEIVVPLADLREYTINYAKKMAAFPPSAQRFAKKGINLAVESSVAAGLLFEEAQATYCCGTEDLREATKAFLEKRKPVFHDK